MARLGSFSPLKPHLLLSLPLCMLSSGLAAQTVLNATDLASLRTHVASANAGSGDFVINVAAGTYTLTGAAGDASPATGDLDIVKATGNLSIIGAATATTIIDANNVDRAFHINAGAGVTVTFQNLTIRNGRAVDTGAASLEARGGGIFIQSTNNVTLNGVLLNNNKAVGGNGGPGGPGGSGTAGGAARGGAIYQTGGTLMLTSCTLSGGQLTGGNGGNGGAGLNASGSGTVTGGNGGNGAAGGAGQGGAIYVAGGTLNISSSTANNNNAKGGNGGVGGKGGNGSASGPLTIQWGKGGVGSFGGAGGDGRGAGIYLASGSVTITNSTISGNACTAGNGGAGGQGGDGNATGSFPSSQVWILQPGSGGNGGNGGNSNGGGIYEQAGTLTINNCTVAAQSMFVGTGGAGGAVGNGTSFFPATPGTGGSAAATQGGGAYVSGGTMNVQSSIFADNNATTDADVRGAVTAGSSLFETTPSGGITVSGGANVTGQDPGLSALGNNGGPTQTHALPASGSPALNAGANPLALTTDQRGTGFVRSFGTGVDMGAYESQTGGGGGVNPPVITAPATAVTINANSFNIQGTAPVTTLVRIYSDANNDGIVNGGDVVVATQQLTGAAVNFSIATSLTQNAANNFLATAFDGTTESAPVDVPTITEDSVAPNMVVITSPASPTNVMAANFTITGTAEANALVRIYRDLNSNGVLDSGEPVVGSQQLAGGNVNFGISTPLIAASINRFLATATDAATNESTAVNVPTITETSIAPTAPPTITTPATNITVNLPSFNIVGTAPANALVRIFRDNNNDGIVNGPDALVGSQQLVSAGVDFSVSVGLVQNAANDFLATAEVSGLQESSATDVPTITDNQGFSGSSGTKGGGGGGGCSTESAQGPLYALVAALGAILLALRSVWTRREVP